MTIVADYFRDLETPRLCRLSSEVCAASFPMMKLMPARYMLDRAAAQGALKPEGRIVETTSGTFGMALALLSAARNHTLTLVTASTLMDAKYQQRLRSLGATVLVLPDPLGDGNQPGRLEAVRRLMADDPQAYWTRQYDSDANWLAYARLADRLIGAMGQIDWLVGCVGTGGSLCGTGHFLRSVFPDLRIAAVDTHRSVLFGHPAGRRLLRGLGNSIMPGNLRHEMVDEVHWVGAYPAWQTCHRFLRRHGLFVGPSSGAAGLVGEWIGKTHRSAQVAVIMPDEGHRYLDTVFNPSWLVEHPEWDDPAPTEPAVLSTIEPRSEHDWTTFAWGRRSRADIMGEDAQRVQH